MVICRVLLWKELLGVSRYLITPPGLGRYSKMANIIKKNSVMMKKMVPKDVMVNSTIFLL